MFRQRRDYLETLARWDDRLTPDNPTGRTWRPKVALCRRSWHRWTASWVGPEGGRYPNPYYGGRMTAFTRGGAIRCVERELARWTRRRRKVARRRAQSCAVERVELRA